MVFEVTLLENATEAQIDELVQLCLQAYDQADTSIRALVGGDVFLLGDFFGASLRAGVLGGASIYIATEATDTLIRGMALWWGPGVEAFSTTEQQAFVSKLSDAAQQWHKTVYRPDFANLTERLLGPRGKLDSWYLNLLAVDPEHQKLGVARALIDAVRKLANHSELTLAATNELNVGIYRRLGFRVRGSMKMAGQVDEGAQQWRQDSRDCEAAIEAAHLFLHSRGLAIVGQGLSDGAMLSLGTHAMAIVARQQQVFPVYVLSWSKTDGTA